MALATIVSVLGLNASIQKTNLADEVKELRSQFKRLKELENQNECKETAYEWVEKIRKLYYRIDDIEDYASQLVRCCNGKGLFGHFKNCFISLSQCNDHCELRSSIQLLRKELENLENEIKQSSSRTEKWLPLTTTCERESIIAENRVNDLVGMEEGIKSLVLFLEKDSEDCPFFVLHGMEGLGKTTMVRKVYNKPEVRHKFMGCAWITAPNQVQAKTLWQDILSQIEPWRKDEIEQSRDTAVAQSLHMSLQSKKYLIVLDHVSSMEALLIALPTDRMRSKVVITTQDKNLAKKIKKRTDFLDMSPLTEAQSWGLFLQGQFPCHRSAFEDNTYLKEICIYMVKKCNGLPLAIQLLGNLMARKHTLHECQSIHKNFFSGVPGSQGRSEFTNIQDLLELSYNHLPGHLKNCLHYLALFPEDSDVEAEKLYNLWIAEGMITSEQDGYLTKMATAETYLNELATAGFVQVQEEEIPTLTKIKSCRLHNLVENICRRKREKESLFAVVDLRSANKREKYTTDARALAFAFDKRVSGYNFPMLPKKSRQVRSLLFLNAHLNYEHVLLPKSLVLKDFRLLRVLDFNSLDFDAMKLPKDIERLANLRYLSFRDCCLEELPPSIGKLSNLEILDLRVNPMLDMSIPNVLCKLKKLRNLYFPFKFHAIGDQKLQLHGLNVLEILKNFVSSHCQANDLPSLDNLKYLAATIEGNLEDLHVTIKCLSKGRFKSFIDLKNFDCYSQRRHSAVRNLLACGFLHALHVEGHISKLSWPTSANLAEIFLTGSELTEDPMPRLGIFPKLQKLGIYNDTFLGDQMVCRASSFPVLRYLKLSNLPKLKIWTVGEGAMLKLSTLTVERCQSLQKLPDGVRFLRNLQELSIVRMPEIFRQRYGSRGKDFYKIQHVPSIKML